MREQIPGQTEVLNECARKFGPVRGRYRSNVRAVGSGGAVDLAENFGVFDALELASEAECEHPELFTERRRGRCLPVRARQKWDFCELARHFDELVPHLVCGR